VFSTSFCAVPAFRRVDPAMNSGPTSTTIVWSAMRSSSELGAQTRAMVCAPASAAARIASTTKGVGRSR